jgi:hypothetical protein
MADRSPLNDRTSPIHGFSDALEVLDGLGLRPPDRMPAVLRGSLRPDPDPRKVWVYDEANRDWLRIEVRIARPRWRDRLLRRRRTAQSYREAERTVERALHARFN